MKTRVPQPPPVIRPPKAFPRPLGTCRCASPVLTPPALVCVACGRYPLASLKTIALGYVDGHESPASLTAREVIAMLLCEIERAAADRVEGVGRVHVPDVATVGGALPKEGVGE